MKKEVMCRKTMRPNSQCKTSGESCVRCGALVGIKVSVKAEAKRPLNVYDGFSYEKMKAVN